MEVIAIVVSVVGLLISGLAIYTSRTSLRLAALSSMINAIDPEIARAKAVFNSHKEERTEELKRIGKSIMGVEFYRELNAILSSVVSREERFANLKSLGDQFNALPPETRNAIPVTKRSLEALPYIIEMEEHKTTLVIKIKKFL